ncbi:MAG: DUF1697 domain-containing protein [Deltaproteobacteria bacterium]|nr:DUF1697 domain-containing protein [Deltaproteobacteria bacterium]
MTSYAAFLRGVSPMNANMADLVRAFTKAGFTDVATVAASGNVVFRAKGTLAQVEKRAAAASQFKPFIRTIDELDALLARDPFAAFKLPRNAKRVITFLRARPKPRPALPASLEKATIYAISGREAFTAYQVQPGNPVFMTLLARTLGDDITTRTWDSVARIVAKAPR